VVVVHELDRLTVGEWLERIKNADVVAVLSHDHEHLLGSLLTQLDVQELICATTPVGEALKIVVGGLIVESVNRDEAVELVEPFAFQAALARRLLAPLDGSAPVDLLALLARSVTPLCLRVDGGGSGSPTP
jgi:hypothetical protein